MRRLVLLLPAFLLALASLQAQIGYPYPGGRYPGGPYPGSGGPYPGGTGGGTRGGGRGNTDSRSNRNRKDAPATVTTTGMLRLVAGSQFVLEADDHRIITYLTNDRTKVDKGGKSADLKDLSIGDHFTIDATADDEGYFTATAVTFNLAGTDADREAAARTWDLPTLTSHPASSSSASGAPPASGRDRDDDGRPILRRKNDDSANSASASGPPSGAPPAPQNGASSAPPNSPSPAPQNSASRAPQNSASAQNGAPAASSQAPEDVADDRPTTMMRPSDPPPDSDDPGKPVLRRGRPTATPRPVPVESETASNAEPAPQPATTASAGSPASSRIPDDARPRYTPPPSVIRIEEDPTIAKAKDAAAEYAGTLPNFFCRQVTTRYEMEHAKEGWQALDVVTADVAYEDGHESYTNIKVGNKAVNTSMDEIPGTRSTGEFASILEDLFAPETGASFRKSGQDTLRGRSSYTYKFEVKRESSHWRIVAAAQLYYPEFRGTVWIDRETSRVLRIEMETRNMPLLFPFDKVETATDYDFVRLSTPEQFLMPVDAEVLSCEQGSSRCLRNRIDFRNYRKFGAESDITFSN